MSGIRRVATALQSKEYQNNLHNVLVVMVQVEGGMVNFMQIVCYMLLRGWCMALGSWLADESNGRTACRTSLLVVVLSWFNTSV